MLASVPSQFFIRMSLRLSRTCSLTGVIKNATALDWYCLSGCCPHSAPLRWTNTFYSSGKPVGRKNKVSIPLRHRPWTFLLSFANSFASYNSLYLFNILFGSQSKLLPLFFPTYSFLQVCKGNF